MKIEQIILFILVSEVLCQQCTHSSNCTNPSRPFCHFLSGQCVECNSDADCSTKPNKICTSSGFCSQCDEARGVGCDPLWQCINGICNCGVVTNCDPVSFNNPTCRFSCQESKCHCSPESCSSSYPNWVDSITGCRGCNSDNECAFPYIICQNNICVPCPDGSYPDDSPMQCFACPSECATCSNGISCNTCKSPYYKDGSSCVETCPNGKYPVTSPSKECHSCLTGCATCSDGTSCDTCQSSYYKDGTVCVNICPTGKWADEVNQVCAPCPSNCDECSDSSTCTKCTSD